MSSGAPAGARWRLDRRALVRKSRCVAAAGLLGLASVACTSTRTPEPTTPGRNRASAGLPRRLQPGFLKGQLHLHTSGSDDCNTSPRDVAAWYARRGYDFIVVTDHNVITPPPPDSPLMVFPGVELTMNSRACSPPEGNEPCPLHVNALFVDRIAEIAPLLPVSEAVPDRLGSYLAALDATKSLQGVVQINHPNFHFAAGLPILRALLRKGPALLEIGNQSGDVSNEGDRSHPSTESLWDTLLTEGYTVYGVVSDDAHHYDDAAEVAACGEPAFTGDRGFVMVRSDPDARAIRVAVERGDFYGSTGVLLSRLAVSEGALQIEVSESSPGSHELSFVGDGGRELRRVRGRTAEVDLVQPGVTYVRAVVTDAAGRKAWTQAVRPCASSR